MKYENAKDVLPEELFQQVQKYAAGKLLYFPIAGPRRLWGTGSGSRFKTVRRNEEIRRRFEAGTRTEELAAEYYLTPESIRNIVYAKKEKKMELEEIWKLYSENSPLSTERTEYIDEMKDWGEYYYIEEYKAVFPERTLCIKIHCYYFTTEARIAEQSRIIRAYREEGCDAWPIVPMRSGALCCPVSYAGHPCIVFATEYRENAIYPSKETPRNPDGRPVYYDEALTLVAKIAQRHLRGKEPNATVLFDSFSSGNSGFEDYVAEYTDKDMRNEIREEQPDLLGLFDQILAELHRIRDALRPRYADLPTSAFSGAEIYCGSATVDGEGHLVGQRNFTDGGADVCINSFLNLVMAMDAALPKDYSWLEVHDPEVRKARIDNVIHGMRLIGKYYTWSEAELDALPLVYQLQLFGTMYNDDPFYEIMEDHDKFRELLEHILRRLTGPDEIDFRKVLTES